MSALMPAQDGFTIPQTKNTTIIIVAYTANRFMHIPPVFQNHIIFRTQNRSRTKVGITSFSRIAKKPRMGFPGLPLT
jgi:hypothetical protein